MHKNVILASSSPRRISLLKNIIKRFKVIHPNIKEKVDKRLSPEKLVKILSLMKVEAVAKKMSSGIIIGVDTIVVFRGKILGKPGNKKIARRMLKQLSGKTHKVITGLTIIDVQTGVKKQDTVITEVKFRTLDEDLINNYISTREPFDKAGAYGIQKKGSLLVESIKGDYYNIVGLPLYALSRLLEEFKVNLF